MLPFLKDKKQIGSIATTPSTERRKSDGEEEYDAMEAAAHDLMTAVHARDTKGIAEALRAAFELADSEPHVEGPHENEE
jgi:hypothetical protein